MRMECSSQFSSSQEKYSLDSFLSMCRFCKSLSLFLPMSKVYAAARNRFLPHDINRNTHDFLFGIEGITNCENEGLFIKVHFPHTGIWPTSKPYMVNGVLRKSNKYNLLHRRIYKSSNRIYYNKQQLHVLI